MRTLSLGLILLLGSALATFAGTVHPVPVGVPQGEYGFSKELGIHTERLTLPGELVAALAAVRVGDGVELPSFPTAAGYRSRVVLERIDVYAPDARIWVVDETGRHEAPRSSRRYFLGHSPDDPSVRLALSLDPADGTLRGPVESSVGEFEWLAPEPWETRERLVAAEKLDADVDVPLTRSCGSDGMPIPEAVRPLLSGTYTPPPLKAGATHSATIAVDTDNEWLQKKFSNNTAAATSWIADLFLRMNTIYERDVGLRLVQGQTTLRVGSDPWTQSSTYNQLSEFTGYWNANMGGVSRVFAMLLSGKSPSSGQASGIAWLDGYCNSYGYSVTQTFWFGASNTDARYDTQVIAHEVGHNAGSTHTHCYSPPIDTCWNSEGGCYSGATRTCPVGGGTLMSYCHLLGGCSAASVFHPIVQSVIEARILAKTPACVQELGGGSAVFTDGFESGNTAAWSATAP